MAVFFRMRTRQPVIPLCIVQGSAGIIDHVYILVFLLAEDWAYSKITCNIILKRRLQCGACTIGADISDVFISVNSFRHLGVKSNLSSLHSRAVSGLAIFLKSFINLLKIQRVRGNFSSL